MFLIYVYVCEHKVEIDDDEDWVYAFTSAGVPRDHIRFITHDTDVWYYRGINTCVAFGDFEDDCDYREAVCSVGNPPETKFGSRKQQAETVFSAIVNGGEHPLCPLIYPGTS